LKDFQKKYELYRNTNGLGLIKVSGSVRCFTKTKDIVQTSIYTIKNIELMKKYQELLDILTEEVELTINGKKKKYLLKEEFESFFTKKNKSAGPRIRKIMQLIKSKSSEIREEVQNFKSEL
jgi:hypothetical protein